MISLAAPAKINLFLEVTGRRRDGYHTLATLFAKIGLHDTVSVRRIPEPRVELHVDIRCGTPVPWGPDNLAARAAALYRKRFKVKAGVRIILTKRIPAGAGLGGGSSDAGTVLRAMARLFPGKGRAALLPRLGARLGADVAVFTRPERYFLGKGVGDRLRPLKLGKPLPPLVLAFPAAGVPTAAAYRKVAVPRRRDALTSLSKLDKLVRTLAAGRPAAAWSDLLFNRLEDAVLPYFPAVLEAKRAFSSLGAPAPLMSGSGSCVFSFAPSRVEGRRWVSRLQRRGWSAWLI